MGVERIKSGCIDVITEGRRRVRAKIISGRIAFLDPDGKEVSARRQFKVPEGSIKSLRPLLQEAFGLFGEDQDLGYWENLAKEAPFSPATACCKLRRAGIDHRQAARLVIENEPRVFRELSFGRINNEAVESFISLVSAVVHREYIRK